jgi:hypothetical protein
MRFLVEYYPATHDFRIHETPVIGPDDTYFCELFDRMDTYAGSKNMYNFKNDHIATDCDLFPYNNSWWLMIEAKSVQQAIRIFWKKMKKYKARSLLKRLEENSHYGL